MARFDYKDGSGYIQVSSIGPTAIIAMGGYDGETKETIVIISNDMLKMVIEELQICREDYIKRLEEGSD